MRRFFSKALWLSVHRIPWKPILIWGPWVLVLAVLTFYGVENWRGERAWRKALALAEERGHAMTWESYLPKEIPEEENLANAVFFEDHYRDVFRKTSHLVRLGRAPKGLSSSSSDFRKPRYAPILTESVDLTLWLDPANRPATQEEAAAQLDAIRQDRRLALDELLPALRQKPLSHRYQTAEAFSKTGESPHSLNFAFLGIATACGEDAFFACQLGELDRALDRIETNNLMSAADTPVTLIRRLIDASILAANNEIAENILRTQKATEPQLRRLQSLLNESITADFDRTILGEMAFNRAATLHLIDNRHLLSAADPTTAIMSGMGFGSSASFWDEALTKTLDFLVQRIPTGWIKNTYAVNLQRNLNQMHGLDFTKQSDCRTYLERTTNSAETAENPYFLSPMLLEDYSTIWKNAFSKLLHHDTERELICLAAELERYRLAQGHYPQALSDLPSKAPLDFFSGKEFRYQRKADGTPHLWSIGSDGTDDGGLPPQIRSSNAKGDLVWMLTPIPGLTETAWRRATRQR